MESQELIFGGGVLGSLRGLLDLKGKLDSLGINFAEAADLMPALDALRSAKTSDEKLTAVQVLVREFSEVTTKTTVDDDLSAMLDQ